MDALYAYFESQPWLPRVGAILIIALLAHLTVRLVHYVSILILSPDKLPFISRREFFIRHHPKIATVTNLAASALTFTIYFLALGIILNEFNISLTAYFATATVLGLAIGFGTQGLVQDIVIGLTLVFSDAFDIGDTIETSGQIGRVDRIGLRYTKIVNIYNQSVYIPNRNIAVVGRFLKGHTRIYVDIQTVEGITDEQFTSLILALAGGVYEQHKALFFGEPESFGIRETGTGGWRYLRLRFRMWPGQNAVIENNFRLRLLARLKALNPEYADWMVAVTFRV